MEHSSMPRARRKAETRRPKPFTRDQFVRYAEEVRTRKSGLAEERGRVNQVFARVEESGGNKKAMRDALRLAEMLPAKRNDYLAALQVYCDWLGVWAQQSLFDEPRIARGYVEPEPEMPLVASPGELDQNDPAMIREAQEMGREDGKLNRSPEFCQFAEGTALREHYDRAWLSARAEAMSVEAPKRRAGRPPKLGFRADAPPDAGLRRTRGRRVRAGETVSAGAGGD
jgi:uncharacterized protein (UPF0335 family)